MSDKLHPISQRTKDIWTLANDDQKLSNTAIAKIIGTSTGVVANAVFRGRVSGHCKPKLKTITTVFNGSHVAWGCIGHVINALSVEQAQWLVDECENCGCLTTSEYIAELVLDAYFEDQEGKTNQ